MLDSGAVSFSRGFDMIVSPYLLDSIKVSAVLRDGAWAETVQTMFDGTEWGASDCAQFAAETFAEIAPDGVPVYPFYEEKSSSLNTVTDFALQWGIFAVHWQLGKWDIPVQSLTGFSG